MVRIGDMASFFQEPLIFNNKLAAKALDDRIGCYCLVETMKRIKDNRNDLYFVFSVQEEVGLRGAKTGAYSIAPKYAIAVDVTGTGDTPESVKMAVSIGKGVAIKIKDRLFISNPEIKDTLIAYAEEISVPYQLEILEKEIQIPKTPFPTLKFPSIYEILQEFDKKIEFGESYSRDCEVLLSKYVKERYKSDFFFVSHFPFNIKPFYVMRVDEEPIWARSVDLIYKGMEQSSGGQREHRYEKIIDQIREKRAEKEYMTLRELISDILRRSVLSSKYKYVEKKTDDVFVNIFSKSRRGRKKKIKKRK